MKLEGIGKYPHVAVKLCSGKKATAVIQSRSRASPLSDTLVTSTTVNNTLAGEETEIGNDSDSAGSYGVETLVDFGEVAMGSVTKKRIEITSVSSVSLQ